MLKLKNIVKNYVAGDNVVKALRNVSLEFRQQEFVSILGQSGCGKTTMLNIIGGLDKYTTQFERVETGSDLLVNGQSTKAFSPEDWDAYRNNTIGFVFQNYNLISHLSVISNVEMALTLSGISPKERHERAFEALKSVGLESQVNKRPNQLSGGQMQRVAIARALVNNPKVILADEPTGALDSTTSVQIMEILKEISKEKLIIMVTHNSEIAAKYSNRIIKLSDGVVVSDSNPFDGSSNAIKAKQEEEVKLVKYNNGKRTSMSFFTALKLSFNNLRTKKVRTAITSFAGSIGIVGIALVLALSGGMTTYVNTVQRDTLSGFPITIGSSETIFSSEMMDNMANDMLNKPTGPEEDKLYPYDPMGDTQIHYNKLGEMSDTNSFVYKLKNEMNSDFYTNLSINYNTKFNLVTRQGDSGYAVVKATAPSASAAFGFDMSNGLTWQTLPADKDFVMSQYKLVNGKYPTNTNELVLITDAMNRVNTTHLTQLGFIEGVDFSFEGSNTVGIPFSYDKVIGRQITQVSNNEFYKLDGGLYKQITTNDELKVAYDEVDNRKLVIVGVISLKPESPASVLSGGIGHLSSLSDVTLSDSTQSEIVVAQKGNKTHSVITGKPFTPASPMNSNTYENALKSIGGDSEISSISIYPKTFEDKEEIKKWVNAYGAKFVDENGKLIQDEQIILTDMAEQISKSISTLIDTISIVLTAFAAISLVVSSIMIGIITYVSVVERTKEIGVLRAIGARKKDISRVFNAETFIIGACAGIIGVIITYLLSIPINLIVESLAGVASIAALPLLSAGILIAISVVLTLVAGLVPSMIAANKDPVVALRSE